MTFEKIEHDFTLPAGYVDESGAIHQQGVLREASLADEVIPAKHPHVQDNPAYLNVAVLSRVVTKLGEVDNIRPEVIERLFSSDFAYLMDFYDRINKHDSEHLDATCPKCQHKFEAEAKFPAKIQADRVLKTEHEFTLPKGFIDDEGTPHKQGVMRLGTIGDEVLPLKDRRVQENPVYLTVILLSRVITKLGTLEEVNPRVIENLYSDDFNYLRELYKQINKYSPSVEANCPKCQHKFEVEAAIKLPADRIWPARSTSRA